VKQLTQAGYQTGYDDTTVWCNITTSEGRGGLTLKASQSEMHGTGWESTSYLIIQQHDFEGGGLWVDIQFNDSQQCEKAWTALQYVKLAGSLHHACQDEKSISSLSDIPETAEFYLISYSFAPGYTLDLSALGLWYEVTK